MYSNVLQSNSIREDEGITVPSPIFFTGLGFVLGILLGPPLLATTEAGRDSLTKLAREKATVR